MNQRLCWCVFVLTTVISGCDGAPSSYFPLDSGAAWTYRVLITTERGEVTEKKLNIENLGREIINGTKFHIRRTSSGTDYFIGQDETGIYRAAKRTIVDHQPRLDREPRYILKRPFAPGSEWRATTHPYVIRRLQPYTESFHRGIEFPMNYHIEALQETVNVPAGTFNSCIKVTGVADLKMYVDPRSGVGEIPIITHEWYAPGVGLVKLERIEKLDTEQFTGGRVLFELARFER